MNGILIRPKNEEELAFLKSLLQKMGVENQILNQESLEDFNLGLMMEEAKKGNTVDREEVMKKLED